MFKPNFKIKKTNVLCYVCFSLKYCKLEKKLEWEYN